MVGENQPIPINGHATPGIIESRSNGRSHRRSRRKEKMRRRTFHHHRQSCIVRKRISMYGFRGVRVGEASNPGPGRAQRRRRVSSSSADTECDPTLLDDFARDLGVDMTRRDSASWSTIPVRSQAVIAVPRPPGSFSSGFVVFADDEQHNDTLVDPIGPNEADANSTAVDSVHQESDTESVLSEGTSVVPESVGTVRCYQRGIRIVNVQDVFSRRVCVMKAVPAFFKGAYRFAM